MTQAGQEPKHTAAVGAAASNHPIATPASTTASTAPAPAALANSLLAPRPPTPVASTARQGTGRGALAGQADLPVAVGLLLLAAVTAMALPAGNMTRAAITLPILLLAPGYLLVQAVMRPPRPLRSRGLDALLGLGVSPPLVGILAFSTSFVAGGFKPGAIVAVVTVAGVLLAALAAWRRVRGAPATPAPAVAA